MYKSVRITSCTYLTKLYSNNNTTIFGSALGHYSVVENDDLYPKYIIPRDSACIKFARVPGSLAQTLRYTCV